ncbi:hypothetical protein [Desulfosporosinus nitroreducens]|uniref:Uncharacterized protein n=1 Tax=Desulfosporosinus nitroreducens TaxID=2018668 RepID=A0ABT8QWL9_9FIRM|nr:hypothetical protein [Desulfosporosinus nitroreducens]MDO0825740.1 hypothetical protein [Desulfosporosinus nitroreducens]
MSILIALKMPNKTVNHNGMELKSKVISIKNQNENVYEIPKSQIDNGELGFYKINGRDGINLEKGDEVLIVLNIKTENVDHCVLGYCINEEYTDFFLAPISDTLEASFIAPKGGEYYIYSIGASASFTNIASGKIHINPNKEEEKE